MTLSSGTRLGPYEVLAPLGAGGMGEVYKARDTRLDRTVAVKVLLSHLVGNAEFRQRLEREARAIAALNHPHICALYDIGSQDGAEFLVLEYLEGETLAARLEKGPLGLEQALRYAIQMADALDKAHRKGFSHRDLKPGNLMITKAGAKLLDFGLAKVTRPAAAVGMTALPTQDAPLTVAGTLLGTFQYMSPEQLGGQEADARSDLFAFGAVLYEMITGRKAFEGNTPANVAGAILHTEPASISSLRPTVPAALDRLVKSCLAKDPDERRQSAHDLMLELESIALALTPAGSPPRLASPPPAAPFLRSRLLWAAGGAMAATLALTAVYWFRPQPLPQVLKLSVMPPEKGAFGEPVAISPDGRRLAFVATLDGRSQIWVRALDAIGPQPLAGSEGARFPFWSPDSRFLGFFAGGKLKMIDLSGGPPQTLCDAANGTGGAWNRDGVIIFAPNRVGGLYRVSAAGGVPAPLTTIDEKRQESTHRWPYFLPDGRHFLYFTRSAHREHTGIYARSLDAGPESEGGNQILAVDFLALYAESPSGFGFLLFLREGTLMAQRFDAGKLQLWGEPAPIAERFQRSTFFGFAPISVSSAGMLAYRSGPNANSQLVWFDRSGKTLGTVGPPGAYQHLALSPDEKRLAVANTESLGTAYDIWLFELSRGDSTKFTFHPMTDWMPVWSPDGSRIAFASDREGITNIYQKLSSGASDEELLLKSKELKYLGDWSRDGRFLAYESFGVRSLRDLWVLPLEGDRKPVPFLQTDFSEYQGRFSPDGRWMAYTSDASGAPEVYIQPFPASGGKWKISIHGGSDPRWRGDGKELFYLAADRKLMAVDLKAGGSKERPAVDVGAPRPLFETRVPSQLPIHRDYAVTKDGQRFLVNSLTEEAGGAPITIVVNWAPRK